MVLRITSKRQVAFPAAVLDAIGVGPDGLLRPKRIDFAGLAPLRDKTRRDPGPFDLEDFRNQPHDPALRD